MKSIIVVMLAVQTAILLVTAWAVLVKPRTPDARRPIWTGLAVALVLIAGTSVQIGDRHSGQPGADVLQFGAALLLGMALMSALIMIRERRGLD